MKLIHCADLHLDSKMNTNLEGLQLKERKGELLNSFVRMVDYADKNRVSAILIAGDLFDKKNISATVRNTVMSEIIHHNRIRFFYLKGNHDSDNFLTGMEEIPENLYMFTDSWRSYEIGSNIVVSGIELGEENSSSAFLSLVLNEKKCNVVMLHGQEAVSDSKDKAEIINLKALRNKGIDYLALGHVHAYKKEVLDSRGVYCYPGCLEGRGFDECGEHGFVVLEIDEEQGTVEHTFVPFAKRKLFTVEVDVTGCPGTAEMIVRAEEEVKATGCSGEDFVKFVLLGSIDVECEKDVEYFRQSFTHRFYYVKVYDRTELSVDEKEFLLDESLKGEFVRTVMAATDMDEELKNIVIRYGLQALAGEEVK